MARKLIPLAVALGALATAGTASADTICVVPATGCSSSKATIASAISQAFSTPATRDTIKLGAAEYTEQVAIPNGAQVDLVGEGAATTIAPVVTNGTILDDQDQSSTVQNLGIRIKSGSNVTALGLTGTADGVSISADPGTVSPVGVAPSLAFPGSGTFRHGSVTLPLTGTAPGTGVTGGGFSPGSTMTVTDSTIQAPLGVFGTATVRRSTIIAGTGAGVPPGSVPPTFSSWTQEIEDTVIKAQSIPSYGPATGISARGGVGPAIPVDGTIIARHDTIVGDGSSNSVGIAATGFSFANIFAASGTADVTDTIVRGFEHSAGRTGDAGTSGGPPGAANLRIAYSDFDPSTYGSVGPGTDDVTSNNINADPQFTDAAFHLAPGSPAIDAGNPAGLGAALTPFPAEDATDRDGSARILDGNRDGQAVTDMGAYEAPTPPPPPAQPAAPAVLAPSVVAVSGFGLTNKVFAVGAKATAVAARKVKRGTTFRYTLSRAAKVTISIARRTKGFKRGRRCVAKAPKGKHGKRRCTLYRKQGSLKRNGVAGRNRVPFSGRFKRHRALKPGTYRATIVAVDAAGRSAPHTVRFKVVRRR